HLKCVTPVGAGDMLQLHGDARALAVDPAVAAGDKDMLVRSSAHGRHSLRLNARRTNCDAVVPPAVRGRGMAHAVRRTGAAHLPACRGARSVPAHRPPGAHRVAALGVASAPGGPGGTGSKGRPSCRGPRPSRMVRTRAAAPRASSPAVVNAR